MTKNRAYSPQVAKMFWTALEHFVITPKTSTEHIARYLKPWGDDSQIQAFCDQELCRMPMDPDDDDPQAVAA